MVIGEFLTRKGLAAILTPITIAGIDILSGESYRALGALNQLKKAHYRRKFDGKAHGVNLSRILFDDFHLAQTQQGDGLFPIDDLKRLVSNI
jgi:hypothetical protein